MADLHRMAAFTVIWLVMGTSPRASVIIFPNLKQIDANTSWFSLRWIESAQSLLISKWSLIQHYKQHNRDFGCGDLYFVFLQLKHKQCSNRASLGMEL